jgi:TolB protein
MRHLKMRKSVFVQFIFIIGLTVFLVKGCQEEPFDPKITGSIEGQVLDESDNYPLANVTISTKPATEVIVTDSTGRYKITSIDTGEYQVIAEKKNYQRKALGIRVKEDRTSRVNILMEQGDSYGSDINFKSNFSPKNGASEQPLNVTLSWDARAQEESATLTYDVQIFSGESMNEFMKKKNLEDTSLTVSSLKYEQVYYWQVIAKNQAGDTTHSQMLNFSTKGISNNSFFYVKKEDGNYEIFAYNTNTEESNRITNNNYRDWAPELNRENSLIGFVNSSNVNSYIYKMNMNGNNPTQITDIAVDGYHNDGNAFAWDEDEGKILFSHYQKLYEIEKDGTSLRLIAEAPVGMHFREIDISPDNSQIVALAVDDIIYNSKIYLMERNGTNKQVLVDSLKGIVAAPTFSIDGESILYTHDISGNQDLEGRMLNSHIFRLNLETNETTDLSEGKPTGTNDLNPTYSPTGHKILFTNVVNDNSQQKEIWMMDPNGEDREKILDNGQLPAWK